MIILLIIISYSFLGIGKEDIDIEPERVDISRIEHPDIDIDKTIFRIGYENNYYFNKKLNFPLMKFFEGINSNDFNMDMMNKEYVEFMQLDEEKVLLSYKDMKNIDYDIISYEKIKDRYVVNLNYREIGTNKRISKSFSIYNNTVSDRSFITTENINRITETNDFKLDIVSKAMFDKYEIYRIDIENLSKELLVIDDSMYGFNAIKENSKYYHNLENMATPYELIPGEKMSFLIKFNCLNPEKVYININKEEVRIY